MKAHFEVAPFKWPKATPIALEVYPRKETYAFAIGRETGLVFAAVTCRRLSTDDSQMYAKGRNSSWHSHT